MSTKVRPIILQLCALSCAGCALQGQVQRQTVEYNTALYGMQNQLVLLNIARARMGLPTYYTSVSRLSGAITVKAVAGMGAQIKDAQPTTTTSTTGQNATGSSLSGSTMTQTGTSGSTSVVNGLTGTQTASTGSSGNSISQMTSSSTTTMSGTSAGSSVTNGTITTAANTLTNLAQTAITTGGNVYTPSVSGEIDSGPSFDINILDTQQFYQGILSGIDQATLANLLDQGADPDIVMRLLVYKIEFKAKKTQNVTNPAGQTFQIQKGEVVHELVNAPPMDDFNGGIATKF